MDDQPEDFQEARLKAEAFIAYAPRSVNDVMRRLQRNKFSDETIAAVIQSLVDGGLLNDKEFAAAWVESRSRAKGLGRIRLTAELRRMGVEREDLDAAMEQVDPEQEVEAAWMIVQRKHSRENPADPSSRRRVAASLARKGYSYGIIEQVFSRWMENTE
ncbi:MAG: regulatory protein RecX [Chthonomonadales bacterium]